VVNRDYRFARHTAQRLIATSLLAIGRIAIADKQLLQVRVGDVISRRIAESAVGSTLQLV